MESNLKTSIFLSQFMGSLYFVMDFPPEIRIIVTDHRKQLLYLPAFSAVLADRHLPVDRLHFISLRGEDLHNQCRYCKEDPLNGNPPPANQKPPENPMMLFFELSFRNNLYADICASAFWTFHTSVTPYEHIFSLHLFCFGSL